MTQIKLPTHHGRLESYRLQPTAHSWPEAGKASRNRVAFAAAHVVANPMADNNPWLDVALDWDATLAYRHYLWDLGLGVAEAMDTAQRGMGLDWTVSLELIERSVAEARARGDDALIACGAGTDHLITNSNTAVDDVIAAYEQQCEAVEAAGGRIILMASRALAACAGSADDYRRVYQRILSQVKEPVIIHWLGDMFDPALRGYWGNEDLQVAMDVCLDILHDNVKKIDGIKVSLLDDQKEIAMRRCLPAGVKMYSGDDFNYPALIAGDEHGYSDALLGIFDAIAPAASAALTALANNDLQTYQAIFEPTVPLSRHIFKAPTRFYKTGVVFMAYLNNLQNHFVMVGGQQSARSVLHLADIFRLADQAGLLRDPELAISRMQKTLALYGIDS